MTIVPALLPAMSNSWSTLTGAKVHHFFSKSARDIETETEFFQLFWIAIKVELNFVSVRCLFGTLQIKMDTSRFSQSLLKLDSQPPVSSTVNSAIAISWHFFKQINVNCQGSKSRTNSPKACSKLNQITLGKLWTQTRCISDLNPCCRKLPYLVIAKIYGLLCYFLRYGVLKCFFDPKPYT